jgi:hypothetical protein
VDHRSGLRPAPPSGHLEGIDDQLGMVVVGNGPAHDAPREDVEDGGAVDLALPGRALGDVGASQLVGPLGGEAALGEIIIVDRRSRTVASLPPVTDALELGGAHEPGHPLPPDPVALSQLELGVDPRSPKGGPRGGVDVTDLVDHVGVVLVPLRHLVVLAIRSIRSGNFQHPAGH